MLLAEQVTKTREPPWVCSKAMNSYRKLDRRVNPAELRQTPRPCVSDDESSEPGTYVEDEDTKLAVATVTLNFKIRTRVFKIEKGSVYGAAVAFPQLARTAQWNKFFTSLTIRSYMFLLVNCFVQGFILTMIAKEENVMDIFAGQMFLCDFGASLQDCPGGSSCKGPGGTDLSPPRLYTYSQWSLRQYVRDSLQAVFPQHAAEIAEKVDPGEYGMESYWCRAICCAIFMLSVMDDLLACRDLAVLLYRIPTAAEPWIEMKDGKRDAEFGLDRVHLKIAGMPLSWKIVNTIVVLVPKLLLFRATVATGTGFLMETAGIDDLIVNSVALGFILNIDEMFFQHIMTWEERHILEDIEAFVPYDLTAANSWSDDQILARYGKYQEDERVDDADDVGHFAWSDVYKWLPLKLLGVVLLTYLSIWEYYARHCERSEEGHYVSKTMYLPQSISFNFLNAFFPNLAKVPVADEPFWQMPSQ